MSEKMAEPRRLAPLDASRLQVFEPTTPKHVPSPDAPELAALKTGTDRMIVVPWSSQTGWANPKMVPYGPISLMPTASALQYATECFEGMKAFRGYDGRLRLFRPIYNCKRMVASAARVTLPTFDPEELLKLIHKLCATEAPKWLPKDRPGSSLYIRPTMIGSDSSLGFKVPDEAQLYIFMVYWPTPKPILNVDGAAPAVGARLLASSESSVRAWPGGTGAAKIGGNYGSALLEHAEAKKKGFDQVLWLYGADRHITEAGSTNIFVMWKSPEGAMQMLTSPLDDDNLILAGNTRRSVIELCQEMFSGRADDANQCEVVERKITMFEVEEASRGGRLLGVFAVGTAFWIQEVSEINFNGKCVEVGLGLVPHVALLRERMTNIMFGTEDHSWGEIVMED